MVNFLDLKSEVFITNNSNENYYVLEYFPEVWM